MRGRAALLLALTAALPLTACDQSARTRADPPRPGSSEVPTPAWPSDVPTTRPATGAPRPLPRPVTIAVAGDVHFEGALRDRLEDPITALAPATATLAAADVAIVNLETSIGEGGRPEPGKRFTFQAPASALSALAAAGVDVANLANNHALDFGREALPGTFAAAAAAAEADPPLAVVGIGRDADQAFRPARSEVHGTIVATIGATVADTDPTADPTGHWAATSTSPGTADAVDPRRLLRAVERADGFADVVVVYMHWGVQGQQCPSEGQRSLAARLVARGADVVVGSHAHRLQGAGWLNDGYVAYGLGNYAWYTQSSGTVADTGVLTLTVQPATSPRGRATVTGAVWEPARIGISGLPMPVAGPSAEVFGAELGELRACAGLADDAG